MNDQGVLKFHFGGKFASSPRGKYVGGKIVELRVANLDIFRTKLIDLQHLVAQLDCPRDSTLSFRVSGYDAEEGLFELKTDFHVEMMINILYAYESLDIYIELPNSDGLDKLQLKLERLGIGDAMLATEVDSTTFPIVSAPEKRVQ